MTKTTSIEESWIKDWQDYLQPSTPVSEISDAFVARWTSKKPAKIPGGLVPSAISDPTVDWSPWLEIFLLSDVDGSEQYAELLVTAIEDAVRLAKHNPYNIIWLRDVLALRRVAYGNEETRVRAAKLIVKSLRVLVGVGLQPSLQHYEQFDRLLGLASRAMVAELYEENFCDAWNESKLSVSKFDSFTVMWFLEWGRNSTSPHEVDESWKTVIKDYQDLIDDLFITLIDINAQAIGGNTISENRSRFFSIIKSFEKRANSTLSNYARFLGLQRKLDIHFIRFSAIASAKHKRHAYLVRNFVKFMSRCDGAIRSQVRRSVLLTGLTIPLSHKTDPRKSVLTFIPDIDDKSYGKFDITTSSTLQELASQNSELADAIEDVAEA